MLSKLYNIVKLDKGANSTADKCLCLFSLLSSKSRLDVASVIFIYAQTSF